VKRLYRVVTADIEVWATDADDAIDQARSDMGGRVHAEDTGLMQPDDDDESEAQ